MIPGTALPRVIGTPRLSASTKPMDARGQEQRSAGGKVGLVILAAGASTRMGTPKQLLPFRGKSLLRHATAVALASTCRPVVVVIGANCELVRRETDGLAVRVAENPGWAEGLGSSIRVGIDALESGPETMDAAVLLPCDQPLVSSAIIDGLVKAYRSTGKPIVASSYGGTLGVPVLFSRTFFSKLVQLAGAEGAKTLIMQHGGAVHALPVPDGSVDVDTPLDYARISRADIVDCRGES
jgi:molybdenum cofactor cytidylyltransferase